jgi:biotin carboxylase
VLLKAVAGGGGRGMAVINSLDGLEARIDERDARSPRLVRQAAN